MTTGQQTAHRNSVEEGTGTSRAAPTVGAQKDRMVGDSRASCSTSSQCRGHLLGLELCSLGHRGPV